MEKIFKAEACPVCEIGIWRPRKDGTHKFRHSRKNYVIPGMHYALCDNCGARGFLPGQQDENRRRIFKFQSGIPGYVSPSQIVSLRERYCLSQEKAAKIFGGGPMAFSKWENGTVAPAEPTAKLIRLALEDEKVMRRLAEMSGEVLRDFSDRRQEKKIRSFRVGGSLEEQESRSKGFIHVPVSYDLGLRYDAPLKRSHDFLEVHSTIKKIEGWITETDDSLILEKAIWLQQKQGHKAPRKPRLN